MVRYACQADDRGQSAEATKRDEHRRITIQQARQGSTDPRTGRGGERDRRRQHAAVTDGGDQPVRSLIRAESTEKA
jgi:hypothetical protein